MNMKTQTQYPDTKAPLKRSSKTKAGCPRPHHTIYVEVAGGLVQGVKNIPSGIELQVIDYDIEAVDDFDLQISPLDGAACSIRNYQAKPGSIQPILV